MLRLWGPRTLRLATAVTSLAVLLEEVRCGRDGEQGHARSEQGENELPVGQGELVRAMHEVP